jgi:hypothetical protein
LVRQTLQPLDLGSDELARKGGGAEDAASSCVGDGRYELGAGRRADGSAKDGMLDPKSTAEVSLQHGASMLVSVAESPTGVKLGLALPAALATKQPDTSVGCWPNPGIRECQLLGRQGERQVSGKAI